MTPSANDQATCIVAGLTVLPAANACCVSPKKCDCQTLRPLPSDMRTSCGITGFPVIARLQKLGQLSSKPALRAGADFCGKVKPQRMHVCCQYPRFGRRSDGHSIESWPSFVPDEWAKFNDRVSDVRIPDRQLICATQGLHRNGRRSWLWQPAVPTAFLAFTTKFKLTGHPPPDAE